MSLICTNCYKFYNKKDLYIAGTNNIFCKINCKFDEKEYQPVKFSYILRANNTIQICKPEIAENFHEKIDKTFKILAYCLPIAASEISNITKIRYYYNKTIKIGTFESILMENNLITLKDKESGEYLHLHPDKIDKYINICTILYLCILDKIKVKIDKFVIREILVYIKQNILYTYFDSSVSFYGRTKMFI